jgi:hypothetical protein
MLAKASNLLPPKGEVPIIPGLLRPIDTAALIRDLRLRERAKERGEQGLPAPDDKSLDVVEAGAVQRITGEWAWQVDQLLGMLRAYRDRLAALAVSAEIGKLRLTAQHAIAQFENAEAVAEGRLGFLKRDFIDARDELDAFRARHRLKRPARARSDLSWTLGLLVFLVALEAGLNGVFFSKGSEFGLIGGVGTAIGISLVNVVAGFLIGAFPARWINYRNVFKKLAGLLFTSVGLAGLGALHFFAAHFREATARYGEEQAFAQALSSLQQTPLGLTDINSWYLFGLGVLFSFGAFWKGYHIDDPYPGYGPTMRRARGAEFAYRRQHEGLFGQLEKVRDYAVAQLRDALHRIPVNVQQIEQAKAARIELIERFSAYETQLENTGNQLLLTYRDANRHARRIPAPLHFEQGWQLPQRSARRPEVLALLADPEGVDVINIDAVLEELRELAERVLHVYSTLLRKFEHPTEMA